MRWRERLQERWGFTQSEVIAMLFLAGMFALGSAVRWMRTPGTPPAEPRSPALAAADSEFLARSRILFLSDPPSAAEREPGRKGKTNPAPGSIDLNTATLEQLQQLPGVGKTTAVKILEYRAENGSFEEQEELMEVSGIGPKKFARIKPFLRNP